MKTALLNRAFVLTTIISVVVFIYLIFLGYDEIKTMKDLIKILASVLFPVPILFFVRSVLVDRFMPEHTDAYKIENQRPALIALLIAMVIMFTGLHLLEWLTKTALEEHLILAHMINSTAICCYVLNFVLYNNLRVNGMLSGVLLSLAIHVFFISK